MTVVVTHSTPSDSSFSASGAVAWDASHTLAGVGTMAEQDANTVAITGGAIDGATVGSVTPAAGTFTTLIGGANAANYGQLTGGATTKAVQFQTLGTDTNISVALQPKGTGAIDLAAGSSGVNISNGGTVTAITAASSGASYTSIPSAAITAPTTAGGVQATASVLMFTSAATIALGGTGYTVGDTLTIVGGTTAVTVGTYTVSTVSGGVITAVTRTSGSGYSVLPSNPVSVTGGTGSSATLNLTWAVSGFTITTAGSGYVEQPTVAFSGGGGSGAAAYATVGGTAKITGIGPQTDFYTPSGAILSTLDGGLPATGAYLQLTNSSASNSINRVIGSGTNLGLYWLTKGTSPHVFATANNVSTVQFQVAHTASAVNYVQVTGGASGAPGVVTMSAQGSSTDVDIAITPRGAGVVKFATYTAGIIAQAGYITIKDSGGTVRRLLVG